MWLAAFSGAASMAGELGVAERCRAGAAFSCLRAALQHLYYLNVACGAWRDAYLMARQHGARAAWRLARSARAAAGALAPVCARAWRK